VLANRQEKRRRKIDKPKSYIMNTSDGAELMTDDCYFKASHDTAACNETHQLA